MPLSSALLADGADKSESFIQRCNDPFRCLAGKSQPTRAPDPVFELSLQLFESETDTRREKRHPARMLSDQGRQCLRSDFRQRLQGSSYVSRFPGKRFGYPTLGGHLKTGQSWTGQNRPVGARPQARAFYRVRS